MGETERDAGVDEGAIRAQGLAKARDQRFCKAVYNVGAGDIKYEGDGELVAPKAGGKGVRRHQLGDFRSDGAQQPVTHGVTVNVVDVLEVVEIDEGQRQRDEQAKATFNALSQSEDLNSTIEAWEFILMTSLEEKKNCLVS